MSSSHVYRPQSAAISRNQPQSVAISRHQLYRRFHPSPEPPNSNQAQSGAISRNQPSSTVPALPSLPRAPILVCAKLKRARRAD